MITNKSAWTSIAIDSVICRSKLGTTLEDAWIECAYIKMKHHVPVTLIHNDQAIEIDPEDRLHELFKRTTNCTGEHSDKQEKEG